MCSLNLNFKWNFFAVQLFQFYLKAIQKKKKKKRGQSPAPGMQAVRKPF